jgi:type IV secretion system protein VirD4
MTRFASAPWPLKAAYVGTLAVAGVALLGGLAVIIALVGLKRLSADIDLAQVPAWFWYFRDDPQVRLWLVVGMLYVL